MGLRVFDSSWFIHYGARSVKHKDYVFAQYPLGGVRFLVGAIMLELSSGHSVVCCFDSETTKFDLIPEYKADRPRESYVYNQAEYAYNMLLKCGVSCFKMVGYEADDLIASVVEANRSEYRDIICYTNDADIAHNVTEGIRVLAACSGGIDITPRNFIASVQKGDFVEYNTISAYKVLVKDRSDNLLQFQGEGGVSGRDLYNSYVQWGYETLPDDSRRPFLFSNQKIFEHYLTLCDLTPLDRENLKKRIEVVFPRIVGEVPPPSSKNDLLAKNLAKLLTILNEEKFLTQFGLERQRLSGEEFTEFKNNAQALRDSAFAVDRNLPVFDSFVRTDVDLTMRLFE